jgi:hypothetical protein
MDDKSRLQLQKMIKSNNVSDQTQLIRNLKHSSILRSDIQNLILLKKKYAYDVDLLNVEAISECNFLWTHYTDLYNKIKKDEIDLKILFEFLDVLKKIEDGVLDQHEGSYEVGILLKKIYVDSALKKAEKLDKINNEKDTDKNIIIKPQVSISWKQYKVLYNNN